MKIKTDWKLCLLYLANSTFKIVDYTNDKSRCTDLYYENEDQEKYKIFSRYINNVISNNRYTSLKGSPQGQTLVKQKKK